MITNHPGGASRRRSHDVRVVAMLLGLLALSAGSLTLPAAIPSTTATPDAVSIKAERLRQNAAIAHFQVEEVASFWTDDVTICRGLGIQLAGKAAYRKLFEGDAPSPTQIVYQRIPTAIEASPLWPLAFETGGWAGHLGGVDGPVVISGRYSAQWVKRGEKWLIRAEVFVALEGTGTGRDFKAAP